MKDFSVYVAASSRERERVRRVFSLVERAAGISLAFDWLSQIEEVRTANRGLTLADGAQYATSNIQAVWNCDIFLLLAPKTPTSGAWFEAGVAFARDKPLIVAGDATVSIFGSFAAFHGKYFRTDGEAIHEAQYIAMTR